MFKIELRLPSCTRACARCVCGAMPGVGLWFGLNGCVFCSLLSGEEMPT